MPTSSSGTQPPSPRRGHDGAVTPAMDHLILTRFSAVLSSELPPAEPDWLWYRLGFFLDACHSSMSGQQPGRADVRTEWLVWFDDRCEDDFRAQVEELAAGVFTPVWTHEVFWTDLRPRISRHAQAPVLVTTRVDSDDAVATDFLARIQAEAAALAPQGEDCFVNFPHGLQLDRLGRLRRCRLRANHYLSLVEHRTAEPPRTVFVTRHPDARLAAPVREVQTPPMWLEVLHGSNLMNSGRGVPCGDHDVRERFSISLPCPPQHGMLRSPRRVGEGLARVAHGFRRPWMARDLALVTLDRLRGDRTMPQRRQS